MSRLLSLHQLCALEVSPAQLVLAAHAAQFDHVCIFTHVPTGHTYPVVSAGPVEREFRAALSDTGITVHNLEIFFLTPDIDVQVYKPALELGASLGGKRATAIVFDKDDRRATDNFVRFCELTETLNIKAGLEFMAFTEVKTLRHAVEIVRRAGHPNGTVAIDALHLMRNGSSPVDVAGLDPTIIGYVQFCDGPLTMPPECQLDEAIGDRLAPGEGEFPLSAFLKAIPPQRTLSLEVPMNRRRTRGETALDRAKVLKAATAQILEQIDGREG